MVERILLHDLPLQAERLRNQLIRVLEQLPTGGDRLVLELHEPEHDEPTLVLTGQYSSGKSTLIKALTDGEADVVIDADIATDRVTQYSWDGQVSLIDTPGVQAGIDVHDELANSAVAKADLVLFCITVSLFDDSATEYLRYLTTELNKAPQLIIAVTKAGSMTSAAAGVREEAIRAALGNDLQIPWTECDANDYLEGLEELDPEISSELKALSNLGELKRLINEVSQSTGRLALVRQPLQNIKSVALQAQALLVADPDEQAALALLVRLRQTLVRAQNSVEVAVLSATQSFDRACRAAAEEFADAIEDLEEQDVSKSELEQRQAEIIRTLERRIDTAGERLSGDVERILTLQLTDLATELKQIEASDHAVRIQTLSAHAPSATHTVSPNVGGRPASESMTIPSWVADVGDTMKKFHAAWGAGEGVKAAAGSPGHSVVLKVGHAFGKKFKPWQAAKYANNIGKIAKYGAVAIQIALVIGGVALEEQQRLKIEKKRAARRRTLMLELTAQADAIVAEYRTKINEVLGPQFRQSLADVDRAHSEIISTREVRSANEAELVAILNDCDRWLAEAV